jgi:hypothetical protein
MKEIHVLTCLQDDLGAEYLEVPTQLLYHDNQELLWAQSDL